MPKSPEERYQEWLERMEIPLEDLDSIETMKSYLKEELDMTNPNQIEALWSAVDKKDTLAEHGIHPVTITYPWGREVRYGVQGLAGLWGWESVQEIMAEETE